MSTCADRRIAIVETHSLATRDKAEAERLAALCGAADGFPQDFHDDSSLNRDRTLPPWLFARRDGELVGMACLFAPSHAEIEVSAWTAPEFRRKGIFAALVDSIRLLAGERDVPSLLFCVDSRSTSGALIAGKLGAALDFSEYEMVCDIARWRDLRAEEDVSGREPPGGEQRSTRNPGRRGGLPVDLAGFEVRKTIAADVDELARASVDIFDNDHVRETEDMARNFIMVSMTAPSRTQYTALLDGRIVGMCAVSDWESSSPRRQEPSGAYGSDTGAGAGAESGRIDGVEGRKTVMLNGLGIRSALRGQGLGRALLYRVMEIAAEGGASGVALEVDSVNEAAYPLYRSAGFAETLRTDYYRLKLQSRP